ncbi:MAG: hypothetical protein ACLFU0_00055 [Alphaproteobacteria bacterium]
MPAFDSIAGIGSGGLIGPPDASDEPERRRGIEDVYRQTRTDWVAFARIVDIPMAATAILGAFPPVGIDRRLDVDGGAVQGVPGVSPPRLLAFSRRWRERYGDRPRPLVRFWFIFDDPPGLRPEPVGLSGYEMVYRSYGTISQTTFKAPSAAHLLQAEATERSDIADLAARSVVIPDSEVANPDARPFDPAVANALVDLGRTVADRRDGGWHRD